MGSVRIVTRNEAGRPVAVSASVLARPPGSPPGLTRGSILFARTFYEEDGLHPNSGLPEFGMCKEGTKSGKPDLVCQARQ
jgi:hypothetical protein